MAVYNVKNPQSLFSSVELTPVSDGNFSFFTVRSPEQAEAAKQWLTSSSMHQEIVAQTTVDGHSVLVTHGDKSNETLTKELEAHGDKLELKVNKKPINFWAIRGGMSIIGQSLQLASAILGVEKIGPGHAKINPASAHYNPKLKEGMFVRKAFAADTGVFAVLNLIANAANIIYGGQKEKGVNRLHAVKGEINEELGDYLAIGDTPIGIDDTRASLREGPKAPLTTGEKINEFAQENSVRFFEIGLRFIAALALVVPFKGASLSQGLAHVKEGALLKAVKAVVNKDKWTLASGMGYLIGKTMALFAKVPDPYEDKPHTWVDTLREDWLFKVGGAIESAAGAAIAYNAFNTKKIGFASADRPDIVPMRDYLATTGGTLFAGGYIVRMGAKFGTKNVDMEEVYAHACDTLAKTPPKQLPQLMADTAATLKEHFKDKNMEFGEIFEKMMTDMYRYHHVALDNLGTEPEERAEKMQAHCAVSETQKAVAAAKPAKPVPHHAPSPLPNHAAAHPPRAKTELAPAPSSFVEKAAKSCADEPSLSMSA